MKKPVYKLMDEKGRVLIPFELRKKADMDKGNIIRVQVSHGSILLSRVDIVEAGKQDKESVEAFVNAAVKNMSGESRMNLMKKLLSLQEEDHEK